MSNQPTTATTRLSPAVTPSIASVSPRLFSACTRTASVTARGLDVFPRLVDVERPAQLVKYGRQVGIQPVVGALVEVPLVEVGIDESGAG